MGQSIHVVSYISYSSMKIEAAITLQTFSCKRLQNYFKGSGCSNVTLDFKANVKNGHFWLKGEAINESKANASSLKPRKTK